MCLKIIFCHLVYFQLFFSFLSVSFSQSSKSEYNLFSSRLTPEQNYEQELDSCFNYFKFYYKSYSDSAVIFAQKGIELSKASNNLPKLSLFHNAIGMFYYQKKDNYMLALEHLLTSLKIVEELYLEKEIAILSNNVGLVYMRIKDYDQSLIYFNKALSINKKLKNDKNISMNLYNIEIIYSNQKNYEKALLFGEESIKIQRRLNDSSFIANTLNGLGNTYLDIRELDKALDYYKEALIISKLKNQQDQTGISLMGVGKVYKKKQP